MSFNGTHTPRKGESRRKQKYVIPMRKGKMGVMEYYLTPELEKEFIRLYPITMNPDLMGLFGLSFSTLQRFKRMYGLEKNRKVILKKHSAQVKQICKRNGYYASMKGKDVSPQCRAAADALRASGFHPMISLKENNPRRYKAIKRRWSRNRTEQIAKERKRADWGLGQKTHLHLPQFKFTRRQLCHRYNAMRRGYILGDMRERFGERYTIYYNDDTERSKLFEKNLVADGFELKELPKPKKRHYEQTSSFSTKECNTEKE